MSYNLQEEAKRALANSEIDLLRDAVLECLSRAVLESRLAEYRKPETTKHYYCHNVDIDSCNYEFGDSELRVLLAEIEQANAASIEKHGVGVLEHAYQENLKRQRRVSYRIKRWIVEKLGGVMQ